VNSCRPRAGTGFLLLAFCLISVSLSILFLLVGLYLHR
jgi:hypothetical protein